MYNNNPCDFALNTLNSAQKEEEKRRLKKTSNLIGAAYIILWLLPSVIKGLITDIAKIFGSVNILNQFFSDPAFLMVYQTVISALIFTLPFLILPKGLGKSVSELLGLRRPKQDLFVPLIMVGVGVSAFANVISNNIGLFFENFGIRFTMSDIQYPEGIFGFLLSFITVAVTPALTEEFATRGMVMGSAREYGQSFALITSATFFSLMHGNLVQIPFAFIMGIVIGFAVIKTGSLLSGIIIHFINNAVSVFMSYLLDLVPSVILQNIIACLYFGICTLVLLFGIHLAQKRNDNVWSLEKSEDALKLSEKLKLFFFSPTIIISFALTVIDCIGTISFR